MTFSTTSGPGPAVRLHSLHAATANPKLKILHIIRHAEGYHNVNNSYRNPKNIDAQLTPRGIDQCQALSQRLQVENISIDSIVASPMRRALQTAYHSFRHALEVEEDEHDKKQDANDNGNNKNDTPLPFVACENWRETVNYICDARLPCSQLSSDFPYVDFDMIQHEDDPIWKYYEEKYGDNNAYVKIRESKDDESLVRRGRAAWDTISRRPDEERSIAVVSHSAFFMHMFTRPELNLVSYHDEEVEELMTGSGFENCELRSVAYEII